MTQSHGVFWASVCGMARSASQGEGPGVTSQIYKLDMKRSTLLEVETSIFTSPLNALYTLYTEP